MHMIIFDQTKEGALQKKKKLNYIAIEMDFHHKCNNLINFVEKN